MHGWQANKKAHLCAASSVRAMPENEIPPARRVDFFCLIISRCVIRIVRVAGMNGDGLKR